MRYTLENESLIVTVDTFGAEIKSVKNKATGCEYIWCGDSAYWGRTAPVLFPFVGSCRDKKYTFAGTDYEITAHGFARDMEHTVVSSTDTEIWFSLKDTEETYKKYPFHFDFMNGYKLEGNTVSVIWKVINPGQDRNDNNLYFSVGAHPAFVCPINGENNKAGYKLFFEGLNEIRHHGNLTGTCTHENLVLPLENNRVTITPEFFDRTTYIVEGSQTGCVGIETPDGARYITVRFDTPLFGIWSPEKKNAPFLCIEPWCGRADYDDFEGDLTQREYGNTLAKDRVFENTYSIEFGSI